MACQWWFFDLVKEVSSNFIKGSHAYQLTRKIQILKSSIKTWKKAKENFFENL